MDLRSWRLKQGKTLLEVATLLGVSEVAVSRYERGKREPRPKVARKIIEISQGEVSAAEILTLPPDVAA
jgi:transcriptional regulator with XRE-family HTH domain